MAKYINLVRSEISEKIEVYVRKNNLKPHDKLPSERELSSTWNVNRMTLRGAIQSLIDEGFLYNVPGNGTYVAPKKIERDLYQFRSLTDGMAEKDVTVRNKLISVRKKDADEQIAKVLSVPLGSEILEVKRVRMFNNEPLVMEESYIRYDLCRELENYDLGSHSLYSILREFYNIKLVKQKQKISIAYVTDEESQYLEVEKGIAVIVVKGVTFNENEEPIEYSISTTRGDRCVFRTILRKE